MKKSIISVALVLSFASALFGLEWGGIIDNSTNIETPDFKGVAINQSNGIHLSLTSSLTKDKSLRFATEGMYKYTYDVGGKDFKNIIDLSLLKLSGNWNLDGSVLSLNAGRFDFSDKTGFAFSQKSDGVNVNYASRDWALGFYAGYTGLLNRFTVNMSDSKDEQNAEQLYDLCYGYVPLMIDFTLTNLSGNVLGLQAEYFIDVTNKNDKAYGSLFVKGPLSKIGSYYVAATVGTNKFENIMVRANMYLQFIIGQNMMIGAGVDYSSGNKVLAPFTGISFKPIHRTVSGVDAIVPKIIGTYVLDNLVISLSEKFVMTIPESFEFNGIDSSLSFVYNIFSDLQVSSLLNAYTDFKAKENNKFSITINASFAF